MLSQPLLDLIRLIRVRCNFQHEFYNKIIISCNKKTHLAENIFSHDKRRPLVSIQSGVVNRWREGWLLPW